MAATDISGYSVHPAAHEIRFEPKKPGDVRTLHIQHIVGGLDRQEDERDAFERWIAGCNPRSSHYQPPATSSRTSA